MSGFENREDFADRLRIYIAQKPVADAEKHAADEPMIQYFFSGFITKRSVIFVYWTIVQIQAASAETAGKMIKSFRS